MSSETTEPTKKKIVLPDSITIDKAIGRGAYGHVYEGSFTDPRTNVTNDDVAIKVIDLAKLSKDQVKKQRQEAQMAQLIESDAVVKTFAQIESGTTLFIVMEKLDQDAKRLIPRMQELRSQKRFNVILHYMRSQTIRLLKALKAFHEQGLVHRDIKPANILMNNMTANMKIGDFGLACLAKECKGKIAGTLNYMEPTCVSMKLFKTSLENNGITVPCRGITHLSDIYSLGVSLFVILTGNKLMEKTPTSSEELIAYLSKLSSDIKQLINENDPQEWQNYVMLLWKMTRPTPNARPTVDQAIEFLETGDIALMDPKEAEYVKRKSGMKKATQ
jgi:serine/threonine protein kinase